MRVITPSEAEARKIFLEVDGFRLYPLALDGDLIDGSRIDLTLCGRPDAVEHFASILSRIGEVNVEHGRSPQSLLYFRSFWSEGQGGVGTYSRHRQFHFPG